MGQSETSSVTSGEDPHSVKLEGWMRKRGNHRPKQWNRRYFTLSDDTFSYRENPDDPKPKVTFAISNDAGCEVGAIYVDKRSTSGHKELLYCIRITWSGGAAETVNPSSLESAPDSPSRPLNTSANPELQTSGKTTPHRSLSPPDLPEPDTISLPDLSRKPQTPDTVRSRRPPRSSAPSRNSSPHLKYRPQGSVTKAMAPDVDDSPRRHSFNVPDGESVVTKSGKKKRFSFLKKAGSKHETGPDVDAVSVISHPGRLQRRSITDGSMPSNLPEMQMPPRVQRATTDESRKRLHETSWAHDDEAEGRTIAAKQEKEQLAMKAAYKATKKKGGSRKAKKIIAGGKVAAVTGAVVTVGVLTAGVGILAGLIVLGAGAAAGGTGYAAEARLKRKKGKGYASVVLASPSYQEVYRWKEALEACLRLESTKASTWGHMFRMEGRNTSKALVPTSGAIMNVLSSDSDNGWAPFGFEFTSWRGGAEDEANQELFSPQTQWRPMEGGWNSLLGSGSSGLRIFREQKPGKKGFRSSYLSLEGRPCPALRAQIILNASPLDSFMCLMSLSRAEDHSVSLVPKSGQRASFRVIESINDHMDVIHMVFHPLYLFPSWTAPRDFVLFRYWRLEPDGTYVICCDSVEHIACPPHPGYTRGDMHCVHTISPRKRHHGLCGSAEYPECLLTSVTQVDPLGWVPTVYIPFVSSQVYAEAFGVAALLQLLDYRDALDYDRFVPVALDAQPIKFKKRMGGMEIPSSPSLDGHISEHRNSSVFELSDDEGEDSPDYDYTYSTRESTSALDSIQGVALHPPPLPIEKWAEPDANSFRVRGRTYMTDRRKINAGVSIGRLIATDVVRVKEAIYSGFCMHPAERVQKGLEREKRLLEKGLESDMPPFLFVVNIVLPGPPFFHGVFYYAIDDMSSIDGTDGTPSSQLCRQFIFGDCDKFRDETFKMIPQIVEGNFIVRKAVGSTPAIMGTKLRQLYVRSDRFCEVILDCGSSSIATGVIRLSLGYAKTLVVDMGFLLEGNDESMLPERMLGAVRVKRLLFNNDRRFVPQPSEIAKSS